MSKSQTYRPFQLTAAQVAELARQAKVQRLHQDLLPELRSRMMGALGGRSSLDLTRRSQLELGIASATSVEDLREVALELSAPPLFDLAEVIPIAAGVGLPARQGLPTAETSAAPRADLLLDLDVDEVEVTLDSIERTAADLGLALDGVDAARRSLVAARRLVADGRQEGAAASLADAAERVTDLDAAVGEALATAEARKQATDVVRSTLGSMGFAVHEESDATGTTLLAVSADGRRAEITIDGDGASPGCVDAAFFDDGHALPKGGPRSEELCDPAVADQLELQIALGDIPGLGGSRPIARGPATRGPSSGAARRPDQVVQPPRTAGGDR